MRLADLIAPHPRVAVVGLAKNTGKTETLSTILRELQELGRVVGVTSIGRDGEARDVIDARIEKPRLRLAAGSLVATTDALLRASALAYETVEDTGVRTPLGRVTIARLPDGGAIEVAGPSAAQDVRAIADTMLQSGAEQVLVDGAIDRRAASSPAVCDGLVMCTGAVLHEEIERVVGITRDAVELARLPAVEDELVRELAESSSESLLVIAGGGPPVPLRPRLAMTSTAKELAALFAAHPGTETLLLRGALAESFLRELQLLPQRPPLKLVVEDSTKVFLHGRGPEWYRRQGLSLCALRPIRVCAVTSNPVAPRSHSLDSRRLRVMLEDALGDVPVLDVRNPAADRMSAS